MTVISTENTRAAVQRLQDATRAARPCAPVRDLIGRGSVADAYAVQQMLTAARISEGGRVVGRKIGLTSKALQKQMEVGEPDFGMLFRDMQFRSGDRIPFGRLIQPRVEAGVAFALGDDLDGVDFTPRRIRDAIECAVAAIDIADSRIVDWNMSFVDAVADNACIGLFVLGDQYAGLEVLEAGFTEMTMTVDGVETSAGQRSDSFSDPLLAVGWLAMKSAELGDPLRADDVILTGVLGQMVAVGPGSAVTAAMPGLGSVTVTFSSLDEERDLK